MEDENSEDEKSLFGIKRIYYVVGIIATIIGVIFTLQQLGLIDIIGSPRAELSIVEQSVAYNENPVYPYFSFNVSGSITNEGDRSTIIKEIELLYGFQRENGGIMELRYSYTVSQIGIFEKVNLAEKESTSFIIVGHINRSTIIENGGVPENLTKVTLSIIHDDGIDSIKNSREISIIR